jgi:peptidoglycan/LPS O-acetylase OafA/YrhL
MRDGVRRSLLVDGLKAVAAILIVLHHLAFYGPMADHLRPVMPQLWRWFANDARMAVQVFLVIGGFLAARSLAPAGRLLAPGGIGAIVRHRFLRLALPYYLVLLVAVACNELARGWMVHPSISAPPTLAQLLAHALLLHDLLGYEALSAGLWYVAIDMQLFMLMAVLLWLGERFERARRPATRPAPAMSAFSLLLVCGLGLASLLHFNHDGAWDAWGLYFFGAYALGASAWWAATRPRPLPWLAAIALLTTAVLLIGFRERLLLALLVALALGLDACRRQRGGRRNAAAPAMPARDAGRRRMLPRVAAQFLTRGIRQIGGMSYALFLVHFPVCLVANAVFTRFVAPTPGWQSLGLAVAFGLSVAVAALFHATVERPLLRLLGRPMVPSLPQAPTVS